MGQDTATRGRARQTQIVMNSIKGFDGEFSWLSNFSPVEIRTESGIIFPTAEHAYQAYKFLDHNRRVEIANAHSPGRAKRLGRRPGMREDWDLVRDRYMLAIQRAKYRDPTLRKLLISTQDSEIVESNTWHDNYWGTCTCPRCEGTGLNTLGRIIMQVRDEIRNKDPRGS
jgi:ribA/ribD-fused uncharacterized protein